MVVSPTLSRVTARSLAMAGLLVATLLVTILVPPIAQPLSYHAFADRRAFLGVPNFLDVASNTAFLVVGALGVTVVSRAPRLRLRSSERWPYLLFFAGVALTSVGSTYYHLSPDNHRLVWDRLPMTLAFTSLFSAVIAERVHPRLGLGFLPFALVLGAGSVAYWAATEARGMGDLRPYLAVQLFPMLAIPLLLWCWPPRYTAAGHFLLALGLYALAKVCEALDGEILAIGGVVSGHTLKHFCAAGAAFALLYMLRHRTTLS